ncbi:cytochrome P450 [Peniophora sp. CONT]|nr:cytochrome P450 [Peniophora sp. CONT]
MLADLVHKSRDIFQPFMNLNLDYPTMLAVCLALVVVLVYTTHRDKRTADLPVVEWALPGIGHLLPFIFAPARFLAWCRVRYGSVYRVLLPRSQGIIVVSHPGVIAFLQTLPPTMLQPVDTQALGAVSGIAGAQAADVFSILHGRVYVNAAATMGPDRMNKLVPRIAADLAASLHGLSIGKEALFSVNVQDLVSRIIFRASCAGLGAERIPDMLPDFLALHRDAFFIAGEIPATGTSGRRARERLVSAMRRFLEQRQAGDADGSLMSETIGTLRQNAVSDDHIARVLVVALWGIHGNMIQVAVWLMIYLTSNPYNFVKIRDAVRSVYPGVGPETDLLQGQIRDVPLLDSAIKEVMRITLLPASTQVALTDIELPSNGRFNPVIRAGERIMVDVRGVHHNHLYHPDATSFRVDRFLDDQEKEDSRGFSTFLPWGGDMYMAHEYAQRIIKLYFIMFFQHYDVALWGYSLPWRSDWSINEAHSKSLPLVKLRRRE